MGKRNRLPGARTLRTSRVEALVSAHLMYHRREDTPLVKVQFQQGVVALIANVDYPVRTDWHPKMSSPSSKDFISPVDGHILQSFNESEVLAAGTDSRPNVVESESNRSLVDRYDAFIQAIALRRRKICI
jgi:hypothetical protein